MPSCIDGGSLIAILLFLFISLFSTKSWVCFEPIKDKEFLLPSCWVDKLSLRQSSGTPQAQLVLEEIILLIIHPLVA